MLIIAGGETCDFYKFHPHFVSVCEILLCVSQIILLLSNSTILSMCSGLQRSEGRTLSVRYSGEYQQMVFGIHSTYSLVLINAVFLPVLIGVSLTVLCLSILHGK